MKTLLGRIMQYGYQGNLSLDWRSQNDSDADKLAHMMATQVLVWETVVGERDVDFNHIAPDNADAVKSVYRTSHPLYGRFSAYYDSIEASVKKHTIVPSFMDRSEEAAQTVELSWDGSRYTATLTDANGVLSEYAFSSAQSDINDRFLTENDCHMVNGSMELSGKIVVVRASALRPEYQSATHQLCICEGGFGAAANSRGPSCFCHNLYSGYKERFRRPDILGTLEEKELPEWARLGLVQYRQSQREKKEAFREER